MRALIPREPDHRRRDAVQEMLAMSLVGDGLVAALMPQRHVLLWNFGPRPYRRLARWGARHPNVIRTVAVGQFALGLWWAWDLTRRYAL